MQLRILAASSSLSRRLWYRNELERRGCHVETASSGTLCVEKFLTFRPDAVVLESRLPWDGTGEGLTAQELEPLLKAVPVLLVDLQRQASQTYRLAADHIAGYWRWPPSAEELIEAACGKMDSLRGSGGLPMMVMAE